MTSLWVFICMSARGDYVTCPKTANSMAETYRVRAVRFFFVDGLSVPGVVMVIGRPLAAFGCETRWP
jgi:hypothetical protein